MLVILLCASCEKPSSRLLEVDAVRGEENGHTLSVIGRGFPGSHQGALRLEGTLYRPGEESRELVAELDAHALSDELLRVDLTAPALSQASGIFEGKIEVRFRSSTGNSQIVGDLTGVRVRLPEPEGRDASLELGLARRARAFHRSLGALELEATPRGLVVASLRDSSLLTKAGAREGDRIERIDGAPVERVIDLLPRDEGAAHVLHVTKYRSGDRVRLVIPSARESRTRSGTLAFLGCLIGCLCAWLLATPAQRPHLQREEIEAPPQREKAAAPSNMVRYAAPLLALCSFVLSTRGGATLELRWLLAAPLFVMLLSTSVAFARRLTSGQAALEHVVRLSAASLSFASLTIVAGSLTPHWFGTSSAALPEEWPLLYAPPVWLALVVLAAASSAAPKQPSMALLVAWARLNGLVAVVALVAGAGLAPPGSSPWFATPAPAALLMLGKVSVLLTLFGRTRPRCSLGGLVALALLAPLLGWLFMMWPKGQELTLPLGGLLLGFWGMRSLRSRVETRSGRARDPALAPFL